MLKYTNCSGINLNFLSLCVLQAIFSYLGCSEKQTVLVTLHTMAVLAPIRAAWTHWLAPLPPKPIKNLCPCIVSPALGSRGAWLTEIHIELGYKRLLKKWKHASQSYSNTNQKYLTKNLLGKAKNNPHLIVLKGSWPHNEITHVILNHRLQPICSFLWVCDTKEHNLKNICFCPFNESQWDPIITLYGQKLLKRKSSISTQMWKYTQVKRTWWNSKSISNFDTQSL